MIPNSALPLQSRPVFDIGGLDVLNCGMGDLKITFNTKKKADVAKAREMVTTMLRQGCFIVITHADGREEKVDAFDPKTNEYIVKDYKGATASEVPEKDTDGKKTPASAKSKKACKKRVPAKDVKATAIAPRSGG